MPPRTTLEPPAPLAAHLVSSLARVPVAVARALAGRAVERDGRTLDPHTQLLLSGERLVRRKEPHELPVDVARREFSRGVALVAPPAPPGVSVREVVLAGAAPIVARVHRPAGAGPRAPGVVYLHGGGWVLGDVAGYSTTCSWLAARARAVVVSIDYRRAPEHRFPAAVDDATSAWREVLARASELGIDPARVALAGDSAGGNLAAVV
ncbi:MAG: alpha/beta hydrolase fold domain-containing protein, partial [Polyangiaceae bacterium]|nr:alpha/beta hydrolase fold domain-containing protein [Polyangiaceae bacterium]